MQEEEGTRHPWNENRKDKEGAERRRVVKSTTGSRRLINRLSVQLFHRPSTPVQQRRAVRNSTAPVLLPRSARVDPFALVGARSRHGAFLFWGSPMCSSTLWGNPWGLPALCAGFILCLCEVSFSSLRQYRQSFPEDVAGLPGHVHAVTSEARKVLLWYALVRSQWPREQDPQTLPKSLRSQGTSAQRRPLPLYPPPFKRWVRGRLTSIFRADITMAKTYKNPKVTNISMKQAVESWLFAKS